LSFISEDLDPGEVAFQEAFQAIEIDTIDENLRPFDEYIRQEKIIDASRYGMKINCCLIWKV
jgi:hypothetical protein